MVISFGFYARAYVSTHRRTDSDTDSAPHCYMQDLTAMMVISIGFYSLAYVSIRLRLLVLNQSS